MTPAPVYGWYGDDFTGATDTLSTIARRGRNAFLFLTVPTARQVSAAGPLEAIGIASAARTMSSTLVRAELPLAGRFFRQQGIRLMHYKCCSTFDSATDVGNLATAIDALRPFYDTPVVPVVGGQPSLGRYCVFSTLFAAAGAWTFRIDRHPTMSQHPATPMEEADLTRHFDRLGLSGMGRIHWPSCTEAAIGAAWREAAAAHPPAILVDALDKSHVAAIGVLLRELCEAGTTLVVGASSVAEAWFGGEAAGDANDTLTGTDASGPAFAFAGSLSPVTRSQIAAARSYGVLQIDPAEVVVRSPRLAAVLDTTVSALLEGHNVLVTTAPPEGPAPIRLMPGLAEASAAFIDDVVARSGVRRVAIAGGDTSSAAVPALGFWGLAYHSVISRGSTVCVGRSDNLARDGMHLLLKGGQMGDDVVFETFANLVPGRATLPPYDTRPAHQNTA